MQVRKCITIKRKKPIEFSNQTHRKDIVTNIINNKHLTGKQLFHLLITENNETVCDKRRQGWIFESICQIMIIMKCVNGLHYTEICEGQLQNIKPINNVHRLLDINVQGGGNNVADFVLKQDDVVTPISIKYKEEFGETDVTKIVSTMNKLHGNYKVGLFVKNKNLYKNHRYTNQENIDKQNLDIVIENKLLFDETDIINALCMFCERFKNNKQKIDDFIELINKDYLLSRRKVLIKKLHQKMNLMKFIADFEINSKKMWLIAHKPRSGKSITLLLICKYLLSIGINKILIMTSVPATIDSFTDDLETYVDFQNIIYTTQDKINTLEKNYKGIVFCSVQYLKSDGKINKKELLQTIDFDAVITDESHLGSSTDKTKTEIIDLKDIDEIRKCAKISIFASGTSSKTKRYYGINSSFVYEWETEDECFMKQLLKETTINREEINNSMIKRHGPIFSDCLNDGTLNKDYSKCPIQIFMKQTIPDSLIVLINNYNSSNNTKFGYSCSSLFALSKSKNEKTGLYEYEEKFALCNTNDGTELMMGFFENIISNNRMKKTIMKQIEITQKELGSRSSTREKPLLFIIYLPTHTGNNNISLLQKTIIKFLKDNKLWTDYYIGYSNAFEDEGSVKENYNEYIKTIMKKTKEQNKRGAILLLGKKGGTGITYEFGDSTLSLDDGNNLDQKKQEWSRVNTPHDGKTIGINVDMNIQRSYSYVIDRIQTYRKITKTTKTNSEILYYLFEQKIFLFDPQNFNNGKITIKEIMSYYENEVEIMMKTIDDTPYLEKIECNDEMRDLIKSDFRKIENLQKINSDLEGEQQDCPKGEIVKIQIDGPSSDIICVETKENVEQIEKVEQLINQTYELCKSFFFPLLALVARTYDIFDFKEILIKEKILIMSLLKDKKIDIEKDNYNTIVDIMNKIIDNNTEIIDNIRQIYEMASHHKLRELIEKHFIPTAEEKKTNAEVPTPVCLVNDMLDIIPAEFWTSPRTVFEPCCGKGNFVLGIFDKFYEGLCESIPDEIERCFVIMKKCIYFADLTPLNVFITTELLKCHVQSYCGQEDLNYDFNSYVGDTLQLNIQEIFRLDGFDAVIGNPPYQPPSKDKKGGSSIWNEFVTLSLTKILKLEGYLLFVHPALWRKPENKLKELMFSKQIHYLSINDDIEGRKLFGSTTRFDYYLLENTPTYKKSKIIFEDKRTYDIMINNKLPFIPNFGWSIFEKMFSKLNDDNDGIDVIGDSYCHTSRTYVSKTIKEGHDFKLLNSISKSKGKTFCYSSKAHKVQDLKKVVFSNGRYIVPFYDNGNLGITQGGLYILVKDEIEGDNIVSYLDTNLIMHLIKATKWSNFETCKQIFKYIHLPLNIINFTNENINNYFNLSGEEILDIAK
jgi:hypothetical protein